MLSALAALGCGLAAVQGDLVFVASFGALRSDNYRGDNTTMRCAPSQSVSVLG